MVNNSQMLDSVFSALADPTRRQIIERLARRPLTVGEIAADFPISQPGISKHVRALEESGLLTREVIGRTHRCTLSPTAMHTASRWIERQRTFWMVSLERLDRALQYSSNGKKKK
ncbi:MAG TPA: metalloregulator ArsR/SmtB family transcription factor [Candidatus Rubrimentiphilum sp.]|nr:metalloregulator ArsR/SmtB family transcription factor [Candidatus Rubrimentiphilum sp.]